MQQEGQARFIKSKKKVVRLPEVTDHGIDELAVSEFGGHLAASLHAFVPRVSKEEEIRIFVERELRFLQERAGIRLEGKHEFTVASGFADSVYQRVVIEYKNPASASSRIGQSLDVPGTKRVLEQIRSRIDNLSTSINLPRSAFFGVGVDGKRFVFARYLKDRWTPEQPVDVNRATCSRFIWLLLNLGQKGKAFTQQNLAEDFGAASLISHEAVAAFYDAIQHTHSPKARAFFDQWRVLFSEIVGEHMYEVSEAVEAAAASFKIPKGGLKAAELQFALHTYYAVLMKLLAAEIVAYFHRLPSPLQGMLHAEGRSSQLKAAFLEVEEGGVFSHLNVSNFLEGDLFAWYTAAWTDDIAKALQAAVKQIESYNPGTLSSDPAGSRDLLKKLYQNLFPARLRHDLGEYYTPDWLAEHTLDEIGYDGDPRKCLLDPACGSGTFLVLAIQRIKAWFEAHRETCGLDERRLLRKILTNVVGFDLNPLAVMAARTNYLIAIRDFSRYFEKVELPIYLCDSILTPIPIEHGDLFAGKFGEALRISSAVGDFLIPSEVAGDAGSLARYVELIERAVNERVDEKAFLRRCQAAGLRVQSKDLHQGLFNKLAQLDRARKNGIWARIIKNAFMPVLMGQRADVVAGNPPWINWESLPEPYRNETLPLWDSYRLREKGAGRASIGSSRHELAALFLYACADRYLKPGGRLGFVITQSLFKNHAAGGFRRFTLANHHLAPVSTTDLSALTVFDSAVNRAAVLVVEKQAKQWRFPRPYKAWRPVSGKQAAIPQEAELRAVVSKQVRIYRMQAYPSVKGAVTSAWFTPPKTIAKELLNLQGKTYFRAFEGVNCGGLVGAYWVNTLSAPRNGSLRVENLSTAGKIKVPHVTGEVEKNVLYPCLRGRDIQRWVARPSCSIILPIEAASGITFDAPTLKRTYPNAYDFLNHFRKLLETRKSAPVRQQMESGTFYALLGAGPQCLTHYKVVFKDLTEFFQCAVVGPSREGSLKGKPVVPEHSTAFIPASSQEEAYFLAGLYNSAPAIASLYFSSTGVQTQRYHTNDVEKLEIRPYDGSRLHQRIAELSRECHDLASDSTNTDELIKTEKVLDGLTGKYWDLATSNVKNIRSALQAWDVNWRRNMAMENS